MKNKQKDKLKSVELKCQTCGKVFRVLVKYRFKYKTCGTCDLTDRYFKQCQKDIGEKVVDK
jgi:transposase-like protein